MELRRKLLRAARARAALGASDASSFDLTAAHSEVDAVIEWLVAERYLSDERFAESRVHARATRFGTRRIQQELSQHGLRLSDEQALELRDSELARAQSILKRRFGARLDENSRTANGQHQAETPDANHRQNRLRKDPASAERARQARFLAGRGFSAEVIQRVIRAGAEVEADGI